MYDGLDRGLTTGSLDRSIDQAACIEGGYFRASRLGGRRCFYRLGVGFFVSLFVFVVLCFSLFFCPMVRASRLGGRRCFYRLGVGWWVYQIERVLRCVSRLTASREATLGRRVSEGVVAFTVWELGGGCIELRGS